MNTFRQGYVHERRRNLAILKGFVGLGRRGENSGGMRIGDEVAKGVGDKKARVASFSGGRVSRKVVGALLKRAWDGHGAEGVRERAVAAGGVAPV